MTGRTARAALLALLWGVAGWFAGLFGPLGLLPLVSTNSHDGGVEAAMTGAFVFGPLLALGGFVAGFFFHRSRGQAVPPKADARGKVASPGFENPPDRVNETTCLDPMNAPR